MARKIKRKMIHKELRNMAGMLRFFTMNPSLKKFKRNQRIQERLFKGKNTVKKELKYYQIYVNNVRVAVYEPLERIENAVGMLWLHGGGFLNGVPEAEADYFKRFIKETKCIIFAPDYTKSYIEPYPKALHESYDVLKYIVDNADDYKINKSQIFIGGVSAGGGLTAGLSLYARDLNEVSIAFQMPLYPMLDDRFTNSNKDNDAPIWNTKNNIVAWKEYLRDLYQTEDVPVYAAPARAKDLSNIPPTLTFIGGVDPFRDETVNYIETLKSFNIETKFREYPGCYHAFEVIGFWKKIGKEANNFVFEGFKYAVKNYFKDQK